MTDDAPTTRRPGGPIFIRPYHIIWVLDCTSSLARSRRLETLNCYIRESLPVFTEYAAENPNVNVLMSAVTYGTGARWHLEPTEVINLSWPDVFDCGGASDAGDAFQLVECRLRRWYWGLANPEGWSAYGGNIPPLVIWAAGSRPSGHWKDALDNLLSLSRRTRTSRAAIFLAEEAPYHALEEFIGTPELRPLLADDPQKLLYYLWKGVGEVVRSKAPREEATLVNIPPFPASAESSDDVW